MLKLLRKQKRRGLLFWRKPPAIHQRLTEKIEQMLRNEQVNREYL
ncbi:hypothetical protein [Xylanibacillus composti]|nr:hypothetical protein [Xylanibacillus composti]